MNENFEIEAESRDLQGKGASRRLRREGLVPGIIYGGDAEPQMFTVKHSDLIRHLDHEAFYSHILTVKVDGKSERAVLKDLQRHPAKPFVTHVDLLRVKMNESIRMTVPLHFEGEEACAGLKAGGMLLKSMVDLEVDCLPGNLPEYIAVDISGLEIGDMIHLSQLQVPEGVHIVGIEQIEEENDPMVVALEAPRAESVEEEEGEAPAAAEPSESGESGEE